MKQSLIQQIMRGTMVENPKGVVSGLYRGYYLVIQTLGPQQGTHVITISATQGAYAPRVPVGEFLQNFKAANKHVRSAVYQENAIILTATTLRGQKFVEQVNQAVDAMVTFLSQNGYISGCCSCGETQVAPRLSNINGDFGFYCDTCFQNRSALLASNQQMIKSKQGNIAAGAVGALIGALIGVVLWVIIYQLGYIAGIAGLVMAVFALKGYEKLGGKIDLAGMIVSVIITVIMVYFAQHLSYAIVIYQEFGGGSVTFFDAFRSVFEFLARYEDIRMLFIKDLVIGYLLTLAASFSTIWSMYKRGSGHYTTQRY